MRLKPNFVFIVLAVSPCCTLARGTPPQAVKTPAKSQQTTAQESLADAARRNRAKHAEISKKRVWTNDDFMPADAQNAAPTTPSEQSDSETLRKFRLLGKEALGSAVLRLANVPDVPFTDRRDWEQRLFEAKQAWVDQVNRVAGHKDSNRDVERQEIRLAGAAQRNFERTADQGIQEARAVNDPVLKAHLRYQHQLDFCKQTSGDLLQKCLAGADQLKWQMEREGTW